MQVNKSLFLLKRSLLQREIEQSWFFGNMVLWMNGCRIQVSGINYARIIFPGLPGGLFLRGVFQFCQDPVEQGAVIGDDLAGTTHVFLVDQCFVVRCG